MKLPSASGGGTAPSGSSLAVTYPGVAGSRVGGVGRGAGVVCCGGGVVAGGGFWTIAGPPPINSVTAAAATTIGMAYGRSNHLPGRYPQCAAALFL